MSFIIPLLVHNALHIPSFTSSSNDRPMSHCLVDSLRRVQRFSCFGQSKTCNTSSTSFLSLMTTLCLTLAQQRFSMLGSFFQQICTCSLSSFFSCFWLGSLLGPLGQDVPDSFLTKLDVLDTHQKLLSWRSVSPAATTLHETCFLARLLRSRTILRGYQRQHVVYRLVEESTLIHLTPRSQQNHQC